jgi:hypothetical protein
LPRCGRGWRYRLDRRAITFGTGHGHFPQSNCRASAIPPQGSAATDVLNVHITPYRARRVSISFPRGTRPTRWPLDDAADTVCAAG